MKYVIALIFVLMGLGAWLAYSEISAGDSSTAQMRDQIKKLETSLQDEKNRTNSSTAVYVKVDEVEALKAKVAELEAKTAQVNNNEMNDLKKQFSEMEEKLKKKEGITSCDQCAIDNCILSQKKKIEEKKVVRKTQHKPYQKPVCPNKEKVLTCVNDKVKEWKKNCKITTTPEIVKSSFLSSEKQVTKNLHREKETLIVSLEPGKTQLPDLSICLESKETLAKNCELKYCAGY